MCGEDGPEDELRRKIDERLLEVCKEYVAHHEVNNQLYIALVKATGSDRVATKIICCFSGFLTPCGLAALVYALVDLKSQNDLMYFYHVWRHSEDITRQELRKAKGVAEIDDLGRQIADPEIFLSRVRTYARNRALELSRANRHLIGQFFPLL